MSKENRKILVFLAFLVFAVYFNSLGNDFVSDDSAIASNPNINNLSYFLRFPYFNLDLRSFLIFLTHKLFDLNPAVFRLTNILFHLGSVWLIYFLINFFFRSPVAFFTASIFAVHPILTEGVTWISGGHYSYSAFFALFSLLTYISWRKNNKDKLYFSSLFFFYLALLSSEKLIIFPLILLIYEFCQPKSEPKTNWRRLVPFWGMSGLWVLILIGLFGTRVATLETAFYQPAGIDNPLIQIPVAISSYLELIAWPKDLTFYHSEMSFTQIEFFIRFIIFVAFIIFTVFSFFKNKPVFFWLSFFLISLSLTLTPLKISWIVAERYVYLGALGILVIMAMVIVKTGEIFKNQKISFFILGIILALLSFRTIIRNTDWKNQDTLWLATAKISPSSPQNHNNLGDLYGRHGNMEKSVEEFQTAISLLPNYADAYHNLGNTYWQMKKTDLAVENFQKALSFNPHLWQSYQNLAAIYFEQADYKTALTNLQQAIKVNPQNLNLYVNLAVVYLQTGEKEKAKEMLLQALSLDPKNQQLKQILFNIESAKD